MLQVSSYRELQLEMQLKVHWNEDSGRRWLVYLLQWDMRTSMYYSEIILFSKFTSSV
jgi:hypothetical protein